MSAIFPKSVPAARATAAPLASRETTDAVRRKVKQMLEQAESFKELAPEKREALAKGLVQIGCSLAEPDGLRLKPSQHSAQVRALAGDDSEPLPASDQPEFGTALKTGVEQAGALMQQVNFVEFVSGLIDGVFNSIVDSSIKQMEAYADLVAQVSKSLNQFRDDNTTQNQGRDHLVDQFPDIFQLQMGGGDWGDFGGFGDEQPSNEPRAVLRQDVDERRAIDKLNQSLPLEQPLTRLDDELVEALLVPAARTQIATGRQQLLATLVMLGINRIVVTDGRISAKVMYDFQARDNLKYRHSATKMDHQRDAHGNIAKLRSGEGEYESDYQGAERNSSYSKEAGYEGSSRDASYYSKGSYKYSEQPIIKMMSTSQLQNDASLQARASLAGQVEVNFKSDYLPLEKMANPEAIAAIQMNAQPGMVKTMAGRPPPQQGAGVTPATNEPAPNPAPATS